MDRLFRNISDDPINYENRDTRRKLQLVATTENPKLTLSIRPFTERNIFQGITATMNVPELRTGSESAYYISETAGKLNKMVTDFYDALEPLFRQADSGIVKFTVGRKNLSDFYYNVLPEIEDIITVEETDFPLIEQYLSPQAKFSFYLDAPHNDVTCRVLATYGEKD